MEIFRAEHTVDLPSQAGETADIRIGLDLETASGLDPDDPAGDLQRRGQALRREFFEHGRTLVSGMAAESGTPGDGPDSWRLQSTYDIDNTRREGTPGDVTSSVRNHLDMNFSFTASSEMHPATILRLGREQIASAFADSMMFDLEQAYLGKQSSEVRSEWKTEDGEVTDYQAGEQEPGGAGREAVRRQAETQGYPAYRLGPVMGATEKEAIGFPLEAVNEAMAAAERSGGIDMNMRVAGIPADPRWYELVQYLRKAQANIWKTSRSEHMEYDAEKVTDAEKIQEAIGLLEAYHRARLATMTPGTRR